MHYSHFDCGSKADAVPKAKEMKEMKAKEESKVGCSVAQSTDC